MTLKAITAAVVALGLAGCGLFTRAEDRPVQEAKTKEAPGRPEMSVGELDQMARNYADRLVARVSTACDEIKGRFPEVDQEGKRARAHQLKLSVALAAYDIVTNPGGATPIPGAAQHVMDLAVLTELHAIRWIDEHAAEEAFAERGQTLLEALGKAREDAWQLTGKLLSAEQIDQLKTMILRWRQQNPKVEWISRVRMDVIAEGPEGLGFTKSVGEGFNPIHSALRAVDETRIAAQQALFYFKRVPAILDWTTEATVADALAVPKVAGLVSGLTQTMGAVSQMTSAFEKLLEEPSSKEPAINTTIGEVQETLVRAREFVSEVRALQSALAPLLEKPKVADPPGKPLDLEAVTTNVGSIAKEATTLVRETRGLAESPDAVRNLDSVLERATRDVAQSGRDVIDHATVRAAQLILLIALLVLLGIGLWVWIRKRRARRAAEEREEQAGPRNPRPAF